jgi:hypothetical protein
MAESLGSVYADVQLRMDNLDKAIMQVSTKMDKLGKVMADKANKPAGSAQKTFLGLSKTILNAVPGVSLLMAGYQGLSRAIQGAVQFAKESIAAYQAQEAANARLGAVVMATGADAWTSQQQLMDMAKQQADATGHTYEEVQNMQSVLLGFTSITGKAFEEASEGLIDMAAVMGGDLASAANQFGKALDTPAESLGTLSRYGFKFTQEQKDMVKTLEDAGKHQEAQAIILGSMRNAFGGAAKAVNDAAKSQNDYNTAMMNFKNNMGERFEKAISPVRDFFTGIIESMNENIQKSKELKAAMDLIAGISTGEKNNVGRLEEYEARVILARRELEFLIESKADSAIYGDFTGVRVADDIDEQIKRKEIEIRDTEENIAALKAQREAQDAYMADMSANLPKAEELADTALKTVKKGEEDLDNIIGKLTDELSAANAQYAEGLILAEEKQRQEEAALTKEVNALIDLRREYGKNSDVIDDNINLIKGMAGYKDEEGNLLHGQVIALEKQKETYQDILSLIDKRLDSESDGAEMNIRRAADRSLQEQTEEHTRQIQDLTASEYEAYEIERQRALLALRATEDYRRASDEKKRELEDELNLFYATQKRVDITGKLKSMEDEYKGAAEDIAHEMENRQRLGESEIEWQKRVIENEKQWALEEFRKSEAYKSAIAEIEKGNSGYFNSVMEVINAIEDRAEAAKRAVEDTSNVSFGQDMLSWAKDNITEIANTGAQVLNSLVEISTTLIQREIEEQNRLLEEQHEEKLKMLDEEMQARLYALGLVEAETVADYEAQLEAAKRTGDELAVYEASQALTKAQIEQEYADEKARIDEELQQKQLELQYKGEIANWQAQLLQAIIGAAQAQISIWAAPQPDLFASTAYKIAMAALAATTAAAQIGVISANKPIPRFETGGIVPGSSYSGDNMLIRANSGEAVLTHEQQRNMMDMLNNPARNGPIANVTIVFQMDAAEIGRKTFQLAGDGHYFLKARAVQ